MVGQKYQDLLGLPIGTDFKKSAPEGFEDAWKAVKTNAKIPFGRFSAAAFMRMKEARLVEKIFEGLSVKN